MVDENPKKDGLDQQEFERKKRFYELEKIRLDVLKQKATVAVFFVKSFYQEVLFILGTVGAVTGFVVKLRKGALKKVDSPEALSPDAIADHMKMVYAGEGKRGNDRKVPKKHHHQVSRAEAPVKDHHVVETQLSAGSSDTLTVQPIPGVTVALDDTPTFWVGWFLAMAICLVTAFNLVRKYIKNWRKGHDDVKPG